jgi:hypothetical protein
VEIRLHTFLILALMESEWADLDRRLGIMPCLAMKRKTPPLLGI